MEPKWTWMVLIVSVFVVEAGLSNGCWEQERLALLQLKPFFIPFKDEEISDCCQWQWVECNITTRRVITLSLDGIRSDYEPKWYFNSSLFLPFEELRGLSLRDNHMVGCIANEGFEKLTKLRHLEVLDLRHNNFKDSSTLLSSLSKISSLKFLSLAENHDLFTGSNHTNDLMWLSRMSGLETLDLSDTNLTNKFSLHLDGLFSLRTLILGQNKLEGTIHIEGNRRQLRLINLEVLDLSYNLLNNSILAHLNGFPNLKFLNLRHNQLKGLMDIQEFCGLSNLQSLDMSYNEVNQFVSSKENRCLRKLEVLYLDAVSTKQNFSLVSLLEPFSSLKTLSLRYNSYLNKTAITQELHVLRNVEDLILDHTPLDINFLQSIGSLISLKTLSLYNCSLAGTLPTQGWCYLKSLEELRFNRNALEGAIASCLGNLTSLRLLDVSNNTFTGNIASTPLTNLTRLQYLSFQNNHFEVPLSFISFANHSDLKVLLSDGNKIVAKPDFYARSPKFQLEVFSLSNCTIDENRKLEFPSFLYFQHDLRHVDFSFTNFGGIKFPDWLLKNNTRLEAFNMIDSSIVGPLFLPSHPNYAMTIIDISKNNMQHQIPTNFCSIFPNLAMLFMSQNSFKSKIPLCFGGMRSLLFLDISHNQLFGEIPKELAMSRTLEVLRLSNNTLTGAMFPAKYRSYGLQELYLDGNNFDGKMPHFSPISSSMLQTLDLSDNHLSGKLPKWLWNNTNLMILALSNNKFQGPISRWLCNLDRLVFLDLSQNNLSGTIPSCFNLYSIRHVHLRKNKLSGPLLQAFFRNSSLVSLDLSENNFTANISDLMGTLPELSVLLLKANQFHGEFPMQLCKLDSLSILDLSQNKISGPIPPCLSNLTLQPRSEKSSTNSAEFYFYDTQIVLHNMGLKIYDLIKSTETLTHDFLLWGIEDGFYMPRPYPSSYAEEVVEFSTKSSSYNYTGNILDHLSGIDLSYNQLSGVIPAELGNLIEIHALNLSHNNLAGPIPSTFSKLKQIESLDLSYNNLNGRIPPQLTELNNLEIFSVAHNNLSGPLPDMKAQFGTFEESSYEGNPLLCGPPLKNSCSEGRGSPEPPCAPCGKDEENDFIDMGDFYISFVVSYVIILLATAIVLYINPYWRRAWLYFIEESITACYFFIVDNLRQLPCFRRRM